MVEAEPSAVLVDDHILPVPPVTGLESIGGFDPLAGSEFGRSPEVNQHTLWFQQTVFGQVLSIVGNPALSPDEKEESLRDLQRLFAEPSVSALEFRGFVYTAQQSIRLDNVDRARAASERESHRRRPIRRVLARLVFRSAEL